jgi:hypothetical protein
MMDEVHRKRTGGTMRAHGGDQLIAGRLLNPQFQIG